MATRLLLRNVYSWLQTDETGFKEDLWRALRFRQKGYFHSALYKQRKWDGYQDYISKQSGRFLTGLLPEVELALRLKGIAYSTQDERDTVPFLPGEVDDQFLNQWLAPGRTPITLHDYQVDYINLISRTGRGIVRAPTRGGKSLVVIGSLKRLPPKTPTLVMTKSTDLCHQLYDDIAAWDFPELGKVIGSRKKDFCPNTITVANVDSVHKIANLLPYFRALYVDEVHLMGSKVPKEVYKQMEKASVRIGISATPFKDGGTDLCQKYDTKGFFGPAMLPGGRILTTKELQSRGILSSSKCVIYPVEEPKLPYHTYMDAVTDTVEGLQFNEMVARLAKSRKGRVLILVERIQQGETLNKLIPGSRWIYGKDDADTRKEVIELLKSSKKCVCIAQQVIIGTGLTFACHHAIFASAAGRAEHGVLQRFGRGLTRSADKEDFVYYDFLFHTNDYLTNHSYRRIKVLREEGHEVEVKDEIDF